MIRLSSLALKGPPSLAGLGGDPERLRNLIDRHSDLKCADQRYKFIGSPYASEQILINYLQFFSIKSKACAKVHGPWHSKKMDISLF